METIQATIKRGIRKMNILLDTSYFLPLIKITIDDIPDYLLKNLLVQSNHNYFYSDLSIFELTAKGFKFIIQGNKIAFQDLMKGIDSIQNDSRLVPLSWASNPIIVELAMELRKIHKDTIDCLIFATAFCICDCIITLDLEFYDQIVKVASIVKEIKSMNENFQFWFNDLLEPPKFLIKT